MSDIERYVWCANCWQNMMGEILRKAEVMHLCHECCKKPRFPISNGEFVWCFDCWSKMMHEILGRAESKMHDDDL